MKPTPPVSARAPEPETMSPAVRGIGFALFVTAALAALAAVVVLPEYLALTDLRARRDALGRHLEAEKRLALYNDRLIQAVQRDPVVAARLLMRHGHYRLANCEEVVLAATSRALSVPERLLDEARAPLPQAEDPFLRAARWLDDAATKSGVMILATGMLAVGILLFGPSGRPRRPR